MWSTIIYHRKLSTCWCKMCRVLRNAFREELGYAKFRKSNRLFYSFWSYSWASHALLRMILNWRPNPLVLPWHACEWYGLSHALTLCLTDAGWRGCPTMFCSSFDFGRRTTRPHFLNLVAATNSHDATFSTCFLLCMRAYSRQRNLFESSWAAWTDMLTSFRSDAALAATAEAVAMWLK